MANDLRDESAVDKMIKEYRKNKPKPVWQFVKDIQLLASHYAGKVEQINLEPSVDKTNILNEFKKYIKKLEEDLKDVVPKSELHADFLSQKSVPKALAKAISRLSFCRDALVEIAEKYGGELLNELGFNPDQPATVGVNAGLMPSISISVVHTAKEKTIRRF